MTTQADFLGQPITKDYVPTAYPSYWYSLGQHPRFTLNVIPQMLQDARIQFGLRLIKGPVLSKSRFFIDCDNHEVKEFLKTTLTRFWRTGAGRALKSLDWGFSCSEVLYNVKGGLIHFDALKFLHPLDCRAWTLQGKLLYASVRHVKGQGNRKVQLNSPRLLWSVHERDEHPWYGASRLFGAYLPWIETWDNGGFRDARNLFFHKYAFDGGTMYHPAGPIKTHDVSGGIAVEVSAKDLAREMLEKKKTGGTLTLPNTVIDGTRQWEYEPPTVAPPPEHMMEYGKDLRDEMWEGMGIPPEIARAEGTGAYAGRKVPEDAFYSILQEIVYWVLTDADAQIFRKLVDVNFGEGIEYDIVPFGLLTPTMQEESIARAGLGPGQSGRSLEAAQQFSLTSDRVVPLTSEEAPAGYVGRNGRAVVSFAGRR